jgi:hypothetical protein
MSQTTLTRVDSADPGYARRLAELRVARTRAEAARLVMLMSSIADSHASALIATGEADEGDGALSWVEVATQLHNMSLALFNGVSVISGGDWQDDYDEYGWKDLAKSRTRAEFAAAWAPLKEELVKRTTPAEGEDKPAELRESAVTEVLAVADAVIGACW